ncbi:uncharacterized protein LOC134822076 [Bolinopsis microptera]|uniref:uncharacterized protein LOC134822076 n=1 Tax=Bolinopsis microptera TaxID=2820187 RepID=UPI003079F92F
MVEKKRNPLVKFCRRFFCTVTTMISFITLCLTVIYNAGNLKTFFFEQSSLAQPMFYIIIYSSVLLICTCLLSLTVVPCANLWVLTTCLMICSSGFIISELSQYTSKYDLEKPEFEIDGYLITWLVMVFLSTLLSLICCIMAVQCQRHLLYLLLTRSGNRNSANGNGNSANGGGYGGGNRNGNGGTVHSGDSGAAYFNQNTNGFVRSSDLNLDQLGRTLPKSRMGTLRDSHVDYTTYM